MLCPAVFGRSGPCRHPPLSLVHSFGFSCDRKALISMSTTRDRDDLESSATYPPPPPPTNSTRVVADREYKSLAQFDTHEDSEGEEDEKLLPSYTSDANASVFKHVRTTPRRAVDTPHDTPAPETADFQASGRIPLLGIDVCHSCASLTSIAVLSPAHSTRRHGRSLFSPPIATPATPGQRLKSISISAAFIFFP